MEARKLARRSQPFLLSLRIRHPSVDPAEISRELGLQPEHSFRAGDPRLSRSGLAPASVHAESYWLGALSPGEWPADLGFSAEPLLKIARERFGSAATRSLGWALSLTAARFFKVHGELLRRIRSEGGQASLLVTMSTPEASSFSLTPEICRVFSELGVALEFEFSGD
jgi:hypothetical protein